MVRFNILHVGLLFGAGSGFYGLGKSLELSGDLARAADDNAGALSGHGGGLLAMLAALACFIYAMVLIVRGLRGGNSAPETREVMPLPRSAAKPDPAEDDSFDADAIMARYLAQRNDPPPAPPTGGFGRKQG